MDRQFRQADAAVKRTVATFVGAIDRMMGRWDLVSAQYVLEGILLELCEELTKRIDSFSRGDATLKLSNALADYRGIRARRSAANVLGLGARANAIIYIFAYLGR
jgi:nucleotidyltransferase/DNA polymerase involved in DNA repair